MCNSRVSFLKYRRRTHISNSQTNGNLARTNPRLHFRKSPGFFWRRKNTCSWRITDEVSQESTRWPPVCAIRPRWGATIEDNLVPDDHAKLNCSEPMLCLECSLLWQEILAGLTKIVSYQFQHWIVYWHIVTKDVFLVLCRKHCKNRASTCPFLFSFSFSLSLFPFHVFVFSLPFLFV